jgi:hypothetical protein
VKTIPNIITYLEKTDIRFFNGYRFSQLRINPQALATYAQFMGTKFSFSLNRQTAAKN